MRRKLLTAFVAAAVPLLGTEALFPLGPADPPLAVRGAEIDYMFSPLRTCSRFGNRVLYNVHSMHSDEFPRERVSEDGVRVLVLGDSIINGGALIDQDDLATAILQRRLREEHSINAIVSTLWPFGRRWVISAVSADVQLLPDRRSAVSADSGRAHRMVKV